MNKRKFCFNLNIGKSRKNRTTQNNYHSRLKKSKTKQLRNTRLLRSYVAVLAAKREAPGTNRSLPSGLPAVRDPRGGPRGRKNKNKKLQSAWLESPRSDRLASQLLVSSTGTRS